jgi:hypothetical protein
MRSVPDPGADGTTNWIGFEGYRSWDQADSGPRGTNVVSTEKAIDNRMFFIIISLSFLRFVLVRRDNRLTVFAKSRIYVTMSGMVVVLVVHSIFSRFVD